MKYKYLFGPVPSRRLGMSLGIDLVPSKVCSMNCIYCESGATNNLTLERKEYINIDEVIVELDQFIAENNKLDCITFSGAGEPLLNSRLGDLINYIKSKYPQYRLALITNSTLLYKKEIRDEIKKIDLILPSLDAVGEKAYLKLTRPQKDLTVDKIIEGLIAFRNETDIEMWLEIFFSPGINDMDEEVDRITEAVKKINPHRVQLNTLDRPGVIKSLKPVARERLEEIAEKFSPLHVEVVAKVKSKTTDSAKINDIEDKIISTIIRRPVTANDLAQTFGVELEIVLSAISKLINNNKIIEEKLERGIFYKVKK
ncbi:MAG: radical SAM protein [Rhodothermaceae bacterium]